MGVAIHRERGGHPRSPPPVCGLVAASRDGLTLAELEALARLGLSVLLALDHPRIAGQQTLGLERRPEPLVGGDQRARDAQLDGTRLTGEPAATDVHVDVV